jgi:protein TonB
LSSRFDALLATGPDGAPAPAPRGRVAGIAIRGAILVALVAAALYARDRIVAAKALHGDAPQIVTLLDEPLPPPEKPPEEVVEDDTTPQEETVDIVQDMPAMIDDQLGVDAAASAGGDAFGLVAKRGGRDLLEASADAGSSTAKFKAYGLRLVGDLREHLSGEAALRASNYSVRVGIWVADDGRIERFELLASTGDPSLDAVLRSRLAGLRRLPERPPAGMPQPIRVRIVARLAQG